MGQLQLGLFVFDLKKAHFVQYKEHPYTLDITVVDRDEDWLNRNMPLFTKFWKDVEYWKKAGWKRHPYVQKSRRDILFDNLKEDICKRAMEGVEEVDQDSHNKIQKIK